MLSNYVERFQKKSRSILQIICVFEVKLQKVEARQSTMIHMRRGHNVKV